MARSISKVSSGNAGRKPSPQHMQLLLQLIYAKANVEQMLDSGLLYAQIADLISQAKHQGLLSILNKQLQITSKGLDFMRHDVKGKKRTDGGWISSAFKQEVEPIQPLDVYLPPRLVLRSLKDRGR